MKINKQLLLHPRIIFFLLMVALSFSSALAEANNLKISGFNTSEISKAANRITFTCNMTWDNSWRNTMNHDAAWVFLKYSLDGGLTWKHASMGDNGKNPNGFKSPTNFEIIVPSDEKGFFIQRTDLATGNISAQDVRFVWDYAQDGLTDDQALAANTINKMFAIEMLYVPQGPFYAGDDASSSPFKLQQGSADDDPWSIQSESAITTSNATSDSYYYQGAGATGENASGDIFTVQTSFPKGYNAFYQMKYELTEGQWVSFFNTLSSDAKAHRDITGAALGGKNSDEVMNRNTVAWDAASPESPATTDRPDRPVSFISWPDLLAYADWAGLRPMTELEFEKSARGIDIVPVADEYVWGKTTYNAAEADKIYPDADETGEEILFDSAANLNRNNLGWSSGDGRVGGIAEGQAGPLRVGIFAENSTIRSSSGAGFFGTMELSGNLSEMVVTIGRREGRQFLGTHGDGLLSTLAGFEGNATNNDWPGIDQSDVARGVTSTLGSGFRGGDFNSNNLREYQISTRSFAAKDPDSAGFAQRYDPAFGVFGGGRLVRTAP